jgi:hypothetical protein
MPGLGIPVFKHIPDLVRSFYYSFEAAVKYENCFIRVDVLEKKGNLIKIHEVKAKSFNGTQVANFLKKDGTPNSNWKKYLYDVAFLSFSIGKARRPTNI